MKLVSGDILAFVGGKTLRGDPCSVEEMTEQVHWEIKRIVHIFEKCWPNGKPALVVCPELKFAARETGLKTLVCYTISHMHILVVDELDLSSIEEPRTKKPVEETTCQQSK